MLVVVCPFLFIQTWWGTFSALHIEASFWCNFSNFSLKIPFLNYCKAITLHICIFPYVIVISSKKNIFPTSDIIFNTHIILAANDLSVSDDSFSRFFFRILLSSRDRKRRVAMSVAESPCFACPNAVTLRVQNPSHLSGLLIIPFNLFPAAEDRPCCLRCTEYRRGTLPFTIILAWLIGLKQGLSN